jgi:hypothetical protein
VLVAVADVDRLPGHGLGVQDLFGLEHAERLDRVRQEVVVEPDLLAGCTARQPNRRRARPFGRLYRSAAEPL